MYQKNFLTKTHFELYDSFIPVFKFLFVVILILIAAGFHGFGPEPYRIYVNSFLLIYLTYALTLLIFKKLRRYLSFNYPLLLVTIEILIISYGIACFGGPSSPFYFMYVLLIAFYAIVYDFKYSFITSSISAVCFIGTLYISGINTASDIIVKAFFLVAFSCFIGFTNDKLNKFNIEMAIYDKLTTLYNRQYFYNEFENMLAQSNALISIVVIDIDNFKMFNDRTGHLEGDRILSEIGKLIHKNVRNEDMAARYGGDEFVIVMPHTDKDGAIALCDRLKLNIRNDFSDQVTISAGFALYPSDGTNSKDLFYAADMAMYQAKRLKKQAKPD